MGRTLTAAGKTEQRLVLPQGALYVSSPTTSSGWSKMKRKHLSIWTGEDNWSHKGGDNDKGNALIVYLSKSKVRTASVPTVSMGKMKRNGTETTQTYYNKWKETKKACKKKKTKHLRNSVWEKNIIQEGLLCSCLKLEMLQQKEESNKTRAQRQDNKSRE